MTRHFGSYSAARREFRAVLDTASTGRVTTVCRDKDVFSVVDGVLLREQLARLQPSGAVVASEGGGWAAWLPGSGVHGEGDSFDSAIDDLIDALRDYAEDWNDHLLMAPNHRDNWWLVELVELSTDDQLRDWLLSTDR